MSEKRRLGLVQAQRKRRAMEKIMQSQLLTQDERLVWLLGDLMNAAENYFGAENPKRLGHINSSAIRIIDEIVDPLRAEIAALQSSLAAVEKETIERCAKIVRRIEAREQKRAIDCERLAFTYPRRALYHKELARAHRVAGDALHEAAAALASPSVPGAQEPAKGTQT
jgi:hypothetical protein